MSAKFLYFLPVFLFLNFVLHGQNEDENKIYRFKNNLSYYDESSVNLALVGQHYLGQDIAIKLYLLKDSYTTVQKATPTSPSEKTIVEKPVVYYAITKLSRLYKREIRKGNITEDKAKENLNRVLDIGLSVFHEDTEEFEKELKSARKPEEIMKVFSKVVME